jgi:predicted DNA-binding antitoxin AbrB/MazE fold protein
MVQHVEAVYENGVLRPLGPLDLPDRAIVHISISEEPLPAQGSAKGELSVAEFESLLDELATDGPSVPGTFSRADIYCDHD